MSLAVDTRPELRAEVAASDGRAGMEPAAVAAVAGTCAFHLAFLHASLSGLILVYALALLEIGRAGSAKVAFRLGFLTGFLTFAPQLYWFWNIFGLAAFGLWAVLAFFPGAFAALIQAWRRRHGAKHLWIAAPVFWMALEYFRGELYFLRFSWLSAGSAFSNQIGAMPAGLAGSYGLGFLVLLLAGAIAAVPAKRRLAAAAGGLGLLTLLVHWPMAASGETAQRTVKVAGMQLEFPPELKIPEYLDRVLERHPETEVLVLSEYSLDGPVPPRIREWCRTNQRYLVIGGKDDSPGNGQFLNTAFVVGPDGEIVFQQAKSVPIQFFRDGLPARSQEVWQSPWGTIAICVCYDLSYRRVTDRFAAQGAQAFLVPFMDLTDWGEHQHRLHAQVGPMRAREYGIPIFRLGSSGLSQSIDARGRVLAAAPCPGQEKIVAGELTIGPGASVPLDAWLAPWCVALTAANLIWGAVRRWVGRG